MGGTGALEGLVPHPWIQDQPYHVHLQDLGPYRASKVDMKVEVDPVPGGGLRDQGLKVLPNGLYTGWTGSYSTKST